MAIVFKPKRSSTAATLPTTSDIADGEFCINYTDQVIYLRVGSSIIPVGKFKSRVSSITSSSTPGVNVDLYDMLDVTALAAAATMSAPTGTPYNGQKLMYRFKDNATARALSWNAAFVAGGVALPTTTVISKILTVGFMYNTANSLNKWMCIASAQEA